VSAGAFLWSSEVRLRLPESWVSGSRHRADIDAGFFSVRVAAWLVLVFSDFQLGCGFSVVLLRGLGWSDFSVATGRTTAGEFTTGDFSGDRSFAGVSFFRCFPLRKCRLAGWWGWLSPPAPVEGSFNSSFLLLAVLFLSVLFSGQVGELLFLSFKCMLQ